ncbi:MAG: hypothetical protein GX585_06105 [Clostridiales bacterium]|nr:hypothetical protein [Clostridiales bacterium]
MAKIDETGKVYGNITVLSEAPRKRKASSFWHVRCDCGKEWVIDRYKLKSGQRSCAECTRQRNGKKRRVLMVGKTFGFLTVIKELEKYNDRANPSRMVLCRCICGNEVEATASDVYNYHKKSCGCKSSEMSWRQQRAKNTTPIGKMFGTYTVVDSHDTLVDVVVCSCICGNIRNFNMSDLNAGGIPHCKRCENASAKEADLIKTIGKIYGKYTVLSVSSKGKHGYEMLCRCECGNESIVLHSNLLSGNSTQCAQCRDRINGKNQIKDLTGMRFGLLTVVEITKKNKSGNYRWICKCDCGETTIVSSSNLLSNHTVSCGCVMSTGEEILARELRKRKIKYVREKKFAGCKDKRLLRFDFFLPEWGWCIECDGSQHFAPVEFFGGEEVFLASKRRDAIKTDFCRKNLIPLVRIHYSDYGNMERVAESIATFLKSKAKKAM